ncbi:AraC family transcriptional regulator [Marinobacterium iners]|jgi:AraC-like DNA-binding protein|uniref:AraC family transcriptional regulator n=1 Tax=Marinobacterium iners TaxID=48076 RepID=UPI001A8D8832|nr:AraC family transcriptional regulator [Marinobacterium iners]QSR34326.1 AraC family transcriptional regulator [Marinobacterium iners]
MLLDVLNNTMVFDGVHPLKVSEYMNQHVGTHRLEIINTNKKNRTFSAKLSYRVFADMGLARVSYGDEVRICCLGLSDVYHLHVVTGGQCCWHYDDDQRLLLRPGQALMINPQERMYISYSDDCEKIIIKIPVEILKEGYLKHIGILPHDDFCFDRRVVDLNNSKCFLSFLDALLTEANEVKVDIDTLQRPYRDILISKLLQQFSGMIKIHNMGSSQMDRSFFKLLTYIDVNIKDDIDVHAMAKASNVSIRTVYNQFSKYFGLTPKRYIRKAKMKNLREELVRNTKLRNVTQAALDYGFTHLGRFSSEYREMFGELPSETIKYRR